MNEVYSEIKGLKPVSKAYFFVMLLMAASIVLNIAMNSICIMLLLLVWLAERGFKEKWNRLVREPFFILNTALFGMYIIGMGISKDKANAQFFLTKNLSLLIIPGILLSKERFSKEQIYLFLKMFIACVFLQMSVETSLSLIKYFQTHDSSYFIYHKLVSNINIGGAIIASFFCLLSVIFLFFVRERRWLKWLLYAAFSVWIVLLDSKLFIVMLLLLFLINVFYTLSAKWKIASMAGIIGVTALTVLTPNPLRQRFADMKHFNTSHLSAKKYNEGMYFDGLSLRLVYIKFGFEIMKENGNYFWGAGTGDAENLLRKKIVDYDMYTGNGTTDKEGYLRYGYHNQYLQKLVQMGISGFCIFMAGIVYCFYMAIRYKNKLLLNLLIIFNASFFTDTLLEHQVGLVSFLVFTCLCIGMIRKEEQEIIVENKTVQLIH